MIIERITQPTGLPFIQSTLADHCRLTDPSMIQEASTHARAAASELQHYAQLALLDQTIRVTLDAWPRSSWFDLPIAPLLDVLTVTITVDGVPFNDFGIVAGLRPALHLTAAKPCGLIVIEYEAGFGASAGAVPPDLVHAIIDQAAALFDARGAGDGKSNGMSPHMARIAARYRRVAL